MGVFSGGFFVLRAQARRALGGATFFVGLRDRLFLLVGQRFAQLLFDRRSHPGRRFGDAAGGRHRLAYLRRRQLGDLDNATDELLVDATGFRLQETRLSRRLREGGRQHAAAGEQRQQKLHQNGSENAPQGKGLRQARPRAAVGIHCGNRMVEPVVRRAASSSCARALCCNA